jgi:hypothetical protein
MLCQDHYIQVRSFLSLLTGEAIPVEIVILEVIKKLLLKQLSQVIQKVAIQSRLDTWN